MRKSINLKYFLWLILLTHLLSPELAYANGVGLYYIVAPLFLLFLILISAGLAVLIKYLLAKTVFKKEAGFSFGSLLSIAAIEAFLMALIFIPFYLLSPPSENDISLRITDYILYVSDEAGIWYFKKNLRYEPLFYWYILLLLLTPIYSMLAIFPNLVLRSGENQTRGWLKNMMFNWFLGLITPSIVILTIFYLMLWSGAPNSPTPNELLAHKSSTDHPMLVKALLKKGADVNIRDRAGQTPLVKAAFAGEVRLLLDSGADVNAKDGRTALMEASTHAATGVANLLLESGADVNAKDKDGKTALMEASRHASLGVVRLLLERGSDVNIRNRKGRTALILASENGNQEIVKLLLDRGADVNARDDHGVTALMLASTRDNKIEAVRLLLDSGADVNAKDKDGKTALTLAIKLYSVRIKELLIQHGAKE